MRLPLKTILASLFFLMAFNIFLNSNYAFQNESLTKAFQQAKLQNEGRELLKRGLYDDALIKFQQADDPALKLEHFQDTVAKGLIRETYYLKGEYDKALKLLTPLVIMNPTQSNWQDEKAELEALIQVRDTHSKTPVYEFISNLKMKYRKYLPPKKYEINITTGVMADFVRCYDQIGDYDGGIALMDTVINYDLTGKAGKTAKQYALTPNNAYFVIRQAFEQDKKEGKKGCMGQPGCVGRATKALIQSDYFPW